jgi:hypothetical protein
MNTSARLPWSKPAHPKQNEPGAGLSFFFHDVAFKFNKYLDGSDHFCHTRFTVHSK